MATTPIFVGIGGDSGSGKSTLAAAFSGLLGRDRITTICLDDFHSLDRRERGLVGLTPLNPRANNFALMEEHLLALKRGEAIDKPVYDHGDGTFRGSERIEPREVVIVQGLHPFLLPSVRSAFDLKVWLDPEEDLRVAWKLQRDVARRGYNEGQVRAEIAARRPDAVDYVLPQRAHADLVVRFHRPEPALRDMGHLNVRIVQRDTLPRLGFDLELVRDGTVRLGFDATDEDGRRGDVIEIDGRISPAIATQIEDGVWAHVDERHHHLRRVAPGDLGTFEQPPERGHSDPLALTQLVLAHRILSAQRSMLVRVVAGDQVGMTLQSQRRV